MILLDNKIESLPKFISAQKLLEDKFKLEFPSNDKNRKIGKNKTLTIELTIGDIACFVKPHSDFVCDTIVRGILPKRHNGLEASTVYVLITDNKFDFYNKTEIADKKYKILDIHVVGFYYIVYSVIRNLVKIYKNQNFFNILSLILYFRFSVMNSIFLD